MEGQASREHIKNISWWKITLYNSSLFTAEIEYEKIEAEYSLIRDR